MSEPVSAALLVIGNEILSGRTQDANIAYAGKSLNEVGIRLREARIVPDDEAAIVEAVNALRATYAYVITTGGIGPTHDDITAAAVARAFGVPLERNAEAVARLGGYYADSDFTLNEARLKMAEMPVGAVLVDNPVSGAPGFRLDNVIVLAGVPRIMQAMLESVKPTLVGGTPLSARTLAVDLPEGAIAATLSEVQARFPTVEIGSYPYYRSRTFGVKLVLTAVDREALGAATETLAEALRALGAHVREEPAP